MAVTEQSYTGNGSTTNYSFTFPYLKSTDVEVQVDATVTTAWTFANATTVQFNTAPASGAKIKILRQTSVDSLTATFYPGSAIKSEDLNDNFTQNLYKTQEVGNRFFQTTGGTMTGDLTLGEDVTLTFEGATDNAHETTLTVADPTADRTITLPNVTGTVVTTGDTGTVTATMLAANSVDSSELVDGSIDTSHIADSQVTTAKIAADAVTNAKIADNAIDSEHYVDGSVDTAHIADLNVTTAKIAADAITGAKIADDAVDSEHLAADSIDTEHYAAGSVDATALASNSVTQAKLADDAVGPDELASSAVVTDSIVDNAVTLAKMSDNSVGTAELVNDSVTNAKIANDQIDSEHYVDGSIDTAHIGNDQITNDKIATDAVNADSIAANAVGASELADNAVDTAAIADNAVTSAKIAANAVTTSEIADAELTTLAGMQSGTASILAAGTTLTATLAEINTVVDGKSVETTISDTDAAYPTSGAVVDYVAAQIAPIGGLEVIATDAAFPNTQPAAGVVISIADAGGLVVNGSGTSTTGRTVNGSTVTINNIASNFNSSTVDAGVAFMVSSTGSGQIYNYHKATLKEADILNLSNDINDFGNRYRVASSAPSSSLDDGDLWYDTANAKMMVYSGTNSAWEEVTSTGDFYINTISSYSGTGGNSATFNGSAYRFVLSNPPTTAQQLIVSVNGVIQKPNSGTGQPSEGFALNGSSIVFSAAPPSGADYFIITVGSTVAIGTPSDNTVSTAKIQNLAVTGDKVATNLDLADNKKIRFGTGNDLQIYHSGSHSFIANTGGQVHLRCNTTVHLSDDSGADHLIGTKDGSVAIYYDGGKKFETIASGTITSGHSYLLDNNKVILGSSDDFQLWHDGSNSYIKNSTNALTIQSGLVSINDVANAKTSASFDTDGAVQIYHNNVRKLRTLSNGVELDDNFYLLDGKEIRLGSGEDLRLFHSSSHSFIRNTTGNLYIGGTDGHDGNIVIQATYGEESIWAKHNGAVELYYDNSKKFETQGGGVKISGGDSGGSTIIGDVFFDNGNQAGKDIDWDQSTAKWTYKDNVYAQWGDSGDLQIYHDGSTSRIHGASDSLYIRTADIFAVCNGVGNEEIIRGIQNGAVELYYDGSKKFETYAGGCQMGGDLSFYDGQVANFGTGSDLQIYHNGTDSYLINTTGSFIFRNDGEFKWQKNNGSFVGYIDPDGETRVYHNASQKIVTTSSGCTVYGTVNETSDIALKENIKPLSNSLANLKQLNGYSYKFKDTEKVTGVKSLGLTAQEVEKVYPELVEGEEGQKTLQYSGLIAPLLEAIKELNTKIETLETKVAALEAK